MRQPRIRSVASGLFAALTMIACAIGCASWQPSARPIGPDESVRATEGLLVIQVRTDLALHSISIGGVQVPFDVRPGNHLRLVAVAAGSYRWSRLGVPAQVQDFREPGGPKPGTVEWTFADSSDLRFRVEAGRINYPGMLEVGADGGRVGIRSLDRTALTIEELRAKFPQSVAKYPIVYSGTARHVFLERYLAARAAHETGGTPRGDRPR